MTLIFKEGDMFAAPAEAVVNTVNCVGVMGKGVALEFKKRWPNNFKAYKKLCDAKKVSPGKMFVFENTELFNHKEPKYLINFPTKNHWRSKSKISYIEEGLDALAKDIEDYNISSISIPPLGCGNGGLDWSIVKNLIQEKLCHLKNVNIFIYSPFEVPHMSKEANLTMTFERAILLKSLDNLSVHFSGRFDRISLHKIAYFLQELGVNFKLEFSKNLHGPYSPTLKKAYLALESSGMINGFTSEDRQSYVTSNGYSLSNSFLSKSKTSSDDIINRLSKLIQGFESPYGLELLSSVHWLANYEKKDTVESVFQAMKIWNDNKRNLFDEDTIKVAYRRLEEDGLLH